MQPTNEQPQQPQQPPYAGATQPSYQPPPQAGEQYGPTAGWPAPGTATASRPNYQGPPPATTVKTARPWLVALVAFLTLLVLIAGLGNQWVTDAINRHALNPRRFVDNAARAVTTYQWRFSPRGGKDIDHVWLAGIALGVTALVLTLLLVAIVSRGRGGFGQAFVGSWLAVVVATLLASYVRTAVIDKAYFGNVGLDKANTVFFAYSAGPSVLAAGLGFGFVVAIVAGLTAVLSRRTEVIGGAAPVAYGEPLRADADEPAAGRPDPWAAPAGAVPGPIASPSPWTADDPAPATGEDPRGERAQHTTVLPAVEGPRHADDGTSETTELPRGDYGTTTESGHDATVELPRAESDRPDEPLRHRPDEPQP